MVFGGIFIGKPFRGRYNELTQKINKIDGQKEVKGHEADALMTKDRQHLVGLGQQVILSSKMDRRSKKCPLFHREMSSVSNLRQAQNLWMCTAMNF